MLGIFGGADASIPLENVKAFESALEQAGVESTVTVYPNQPHAFVKNAEGIKAGGAQGAAWSQMLRFFQGALQAHGDDARGHRRATAGRGRLLRLGPSPAARPRTRRPRQPVERRHAH